MSRYKFFLTLLCGLVSVSILLSLGTWQLFRLQEKKTLIKILNTTYQSPPRLFTDIKTPKEYQHVLLKGRWLLNYAFFIEGKTQQGKLGKYFIVPLKLEDKKIILINRGWVPLKYHMSHSSINVHVHLPVIISYPRKPKWISSTGNDWYWIDCKRAQKWLGKNVLSYYGSARINLGDQHVIPLAATPPVLPNNHLAYAFIWYSLAVSLCIVLWCLLRRDR